MMYLCFCLALVVVITTAAKAELKEELLSSFFHNPVLDGGFTTMDALLKSRGINVKEVIKSHFVANRTVGRSNSITVKEEGELLSGFIEAVLYEDNTCTRPILKQYTKLNNCVPFGDTGAYVTLNFRPNYYGQNLNQVIYTLYADDRCAEKIQDLLVAPIPFHICSRNGAIIVHRDEVPQPSESLLPVLLGQYDTLNNCLANNVQNGLFDGYSFQKNFCIPGSADLFINGCDSKGQLVGTLYPSSDGSCTLIDGNNGGRRKLQDIYQFRAPPNTLCEHSESLGFFGFSGYPNFHCR